MKETVLNLLRASLLSSDPIPEVTRLEIAEIDEPEGAFSSAR